MSGDKWGIILSGWVWVGKYFGWMGMNSTELVEFAVFPECNCLMPTFLFTSSCLMLCLIQRQFYVLIIEQHVLERR